MFSHIPIPRPAAYSIKQEDHGGLKPLFVDKGGSKTTLTEFFFYIFSNVSFWQSLSEFQVTTLIDITDLFLWSTYVFLP